MSENYFATGQCLCGKVKYSTSSKPLRMAQCHCDDCRKSSGTGHISNAFFYTSDVDIKGETTCYDSATDSGSIISRHFCPTCGSRLFGINSAAKNMIGVTAGTLDDSSWFKPDFIVYSKSKPDWDFMDDSVLTFEEMPPAKN